ncbi:T9SS type A sorting domain-containing protein [Balneolales bacterium ANBcel1]|nr:T9SS type A sorting domain-containing protein [Balneolales bacterium ANBcel1]
MRKIGVLLLVMFALMRPGLPSGEVYGQHTIRCMLPYEDISGASRDQLPPHTKALLAASKTSTDTTGLKSYISDSGIFRILYTTEGRDSVPAVYTLNPDVPDHVIQTAHYADSSYRYQVETLGFTDPTVRRVNDCREWGDGSHQDTMITIRYSDFGFYGTFSRERPFEIVVHSNFDGFPPNDYQDHRLGALKATIAHEFKHAIQYATNCFRGDAGNTSWLEMDATMMENIVHPDVNDYYNYIDEPWSLFRSPESTVPSSSVSRSYSHVTWSLFYAEHYGISYWVDVWDRIRDNHYLPFIEAMSAELVNRGDNFESALIRNHLWHMAPADYTSAADMPGEPDPVVYYGFSEQGRYPAAGMYAQYTNLPGFPDDPVEIPPRAARYFEFQADEIGEKGQAALALFEDRPGIGIGLLAKTLSGDLIELIIPSSTNNPPKHRLPLQWEELRWLGMVAVNSNHQLPVNNQIFAGSGDAIDGIWAYGDLLRNGLPTHDDAQNILSYPVNNASPSAFQRYIGDVSGNGTLTPYDASLLFRHLDGDLPSFPADSRGTGKAPSWEAFGSIDASGSTVFPAAKLDPDSGPRDTVIVELRTRSSVVFADHDMSLVLSVSGASDSLWYSLYLELDIDYPVGYDGSKPENLGLRFLDDLETANEPGQSEGWEYYFDQNTLRLAYASSVPMGSGPDWILENTPDDLLVLNWRPSNSGDVHFSVADFRLDEHEYVVHHPAMDTIVVSAPVDAGPPSHTPAAFELSQNYPNPFNPETRISFTLPEQVPVRLEVFDITGRLVTTLLDEVRGEGYHSVRFDAGNYHALSSGVYLYRIQAGAYRETRKMTLVK